VTDLIDPVAVETSINEVLAAYRRIDVLANIAGGFHMGPLIQDTGDRDWDFMMNLNARSVFNTCRRVIPVMLEHGGGRIINVSARAAEQGKGRMGPYCASKAAVLTLTESLAAENKFSGINVNCILPGTIDTPQNRAAMPDTEFSRWVPPAALADVVMFLASRAARCVTGASIPVYGQS
jgi:NAD(P)-dependent dehydrogenase (short-subunit alcohol dehydrogenase family)